MLLAYIYKTYHFRYYSQDVFNSVNFNSKTLSLGLVILLPSFLKQENSYSSLQPNTGCIEPV